MADYELYKFKNLTPLEIQLLDAIRVRGQELDVDCDKLQQALVCDPMWLDWGRRYLSLGINCLVRSISKQGGF